MNNKEQSIWAYGVGPNSLSTGKDQGVEKMSNNVTTYEGFKDEVLNSFYEQYGVFRPKDCTEERLKNAFAKKVSARKYVILEAERLRLVKLC